VGHVKKGREGGETECGWKGCKLKVHLEKGGGGRRFTKFSLKKGQEG